MPLATPQGTLDFKSVDTITFVGASSNTVIDTTTGSFGVGVDANGPTSNLHVVGDALITGNVADLNIVSNVNMLHTSNTASIKLNSNVVTEFPRSKKLIKYPRVGLGTNTSAYSGLSGGSTVSGHTIKASNEYNGNFLASKAFTGTNDTNDLDTWITSSTAYSSNTPVANSATLTKFGQQGSWLEIKLPNAIQLHYTHVFNRRTHLTERNDTADIWASNTGNDGDWVKLAKINFNNTYTDTIPMVADIDTPTYYQYFAIQITKINWSGSYANIGQWELFGIPEYDPEAHGVDVVVKSVPNVPNTDWLDVYYDAKDLADGAVSTTSGAITGLGGTTNNGTAFGDPQVSNGAFVFDGTGDYIDASVSSTFTGNQMYTFSSWIKPNSHPSGYIGVFGIGTNSTNDSIGLFLDSGTIIHLTYGNNLVTTTYATIGEWVHITGTYDGTGRTIFVNGKLVGTDSYSSLTLAGTTFRLGSNLVGGQNFNGSIANFRLFNRALTTDEIYQLYAYQKEYFGHGDLSMTLKAGRLGIGTSEPRAALDVRGRIMREYNPGEVIEELHTVCNGRPVTVQSGTYTPTNVTASQTSSATHAEINGSNITYIKPVGAKRIYYKFACQWEDASLGAISNFSIRVYHNGAWREQYHSRYTHAAAYVNDGNHHAHAWVINEYIFECDAETESQHDGRFLSSKASYQFQVTWRQHGSGTSYQSRLHVNDFWDGIGTDVIHPPQLTIRAIA